MGPFGPADLLLTDVVAAQTVANLEVNNMAAVEIQTGSGHDTVNVSGAIAVPLAVHGGDAVAADVLNFTGDGAAPVTIDLAAQTVTEAGLERRAALRP